MKNNLRVARKFRGITQKQLAKLTNISKTSISNIEIEFQSPSLSNAVSICKALDLPIYLVFPDTGISYRNFTEDIENFYRFAYKKYYQVVI